jgi:hypothetical protein
VNLRAAAVVFDETHFPEPIQKETDSRPRDAFPFHPNPLPEAFSTIIFHVFNIAQIREKPGLYKG